METNRVEVEVKAVKMTDASSPVIPMDSDLDADELSSLLFPGAFPVAVTSESAAPGASSQSKQKEVEKPDSLVTRLLLTPLLGLSFLVSLLLVDRRNRLVRTKSHPTVPLLQPGEKPPSLLTRARTYVFAPPASGEPYAYLRSASTAGPTAGGKRWENWAYHAKQGKMFKAEMDDAFVLRTWVMAVLVTGGVAAVSGVGVVGWWVWCWYGEGILAVLGRGWERIGF